MAKDATTSSAAVLDRLCMALGIPIGHGADVALGDRLGVTGAAVGNWRSRDSINCKLVNDLCRRESISLDYVYIGRGTARPVADIRPEVAEHIAQMERSLTAMKRLLESPPEASASITSPDSLGERVKRQ